MWERKYLTMTSFLQGRQKIHSTCFPTNQFRLATSLYFPRRLKFPSRMDILRSVQPSAPNNAHMKHFDYICIRVWAFWTRIRLTRPKVFELSNHSKTFAEQNNYFFNFPQSANLLSQALMIRLQDVIRSHITPVDSWTLSMNIIVAKVEYLVPLRCLLRYRSFLKHYRDDIPQDLTVTGRLFQFESKSLFWMFVLRAVDERGPGMKVYKTRYV